MKRNKLITIFALTAMVAMIQTAQATITLADLASGTINGTAVSGGTISSITIGDKTFSGFSYDASGLTSFDPNSIDVTVSEVGGNYFLKWGGNISLVSAGPATADLKLNYTVTANPGQIVAIDQNYTGSAQPAGGAYISIVENAYVPGNANPIGHSSLSATDLSDQIGRAHV